MMIITTKNKKDRKQKKKNIFQPLDTFMINLTSLEKNMSSKIQKENLIKKVEQEKERLKKENIILKKEIDKKKRTIKESIKARNPIASNKALEFQEEFRKQKEYDNGYRDPLDNDY